ncbi:CBS domain-containing protein [Pectinatus brassicae]|uniref:CBS domain-containing protein n=1 Tax=Pectinatus brassicae TaxID=862415 RepID=A0A840UKD2_9FIRM|nr:CBS domain-containing protein [Pectinatus brassicae]MBB5336640.1 CBS domain-containing protein [Pectinatus brassicae]
MKISFFLIPKDDIVYLDSNATLRQAMEKMKYHSYTAVPLINKDGSYAGTLTEGDILWALNDKINFAAKDTEHINLKTIHKKFHNKVVHIDAEMEDLLTLSMNQNFIPVVDDRNIFIGIIRRREIIEYFAKKYYSQQHIHHYDKNNISLSLAK